MWFYSTVGRNRGLWVTGLRLQITNLSEVLVLMCDDDDDDDLWTGLRVELWCQWGCSGFFVLLLLLFSLLPVLLMRLNYLFDNSWVI